MLGGFGKTVNSLAASTSKSLAMKRRQEELAAQAAKAAPQPAPQPAAQPAPAPVAQPAKPSFTEKAPTYVEAPTANLGQAATEAMTRRYDLLRSKAAGQVRVQTQEEQDAIKRRMSALGGLNSGAYVKQNTLAQERGAQRTQAANESLDTAQLAEQERLDESQRAREFQSQERRAGQGFASLESYKQRAFTAGQTDVDRAIAAERFSKEFGMQEKSFGMQEKSFELQQKTFELEKKIQEFNMEMAQSEANKTTIFDGIGNLGTGVWKGITDNPFG